MPFIGRFTGRQKRPPKKNVICNICCNEIYKGRDGSSRSKSTKPEIYSKSAQQCHFCALICDLYIAARAAWNRDFELFNSEWESQDIEISFPAPGHPPFINFKEVGFYVFFPNGLRTEQFPPHPKLPLWSPVSEHAGSEDSLRLAKTWLRSCLEEHPDCEDMSNVPLPPRLVQILEHDAQSDSFKLRLVETNEENGSYVTLSHCWGDIQPLKTLEGNLNPLKEDIPWAELPRTFRDAVRVSSYLGYRYIWIDSLCIIQDSLADWEVQSAQIGRIYERSVVTIIAASASGHDKGILVQKDIAAGNVMLGGEFPGSPPTPVRYQELLGHYSSHGFLEQDPIDRRAWTYQERLLATRSLIYSTQEMRWECNAMHCCECGMKDISFKEKLHPYSIRHISECNRSEALKYWYGTIVSIYSKRSLTRGTDKLPAVSGVVALLAEKIGGNYIAGLWEADLIIGLLWMPHFREPWKGIYKCPEEYQAPSFSWASLGGGVYYRVDEEFVKTTELVEPPKATVGLNPYGYVQGTSIVMEGPVTRSWIRFPQDWNQGGWVDITCENDKPGPDYHWKGLGFKADTQLTASRLPEDYTRDDWSAGSDYTPHRSNIDVSDTTRDCYLCQCLLVCTVAVGDEDGFEAGHEWFYLVLALSLRTPGAFERLGLYTLDKFRKAPEMQQRAVKRRLTIV